MAEPSEPQDNPMDIDVDWWCGLLQTRPNYPYDLTTFPVHLWTGYQLAKVKPINAFEDVFLHEFNLRGEVEFRNEYGPSINDIWGMYVFSQDFTPHKLLFVFEFLNPEFKTLPFGSSVYDFTLSILGWVQ